MRWTGLWVLPAIVAKMAAPLVAAVGITIAPTSLTVDQGGTGTFSATVTGATNKAVTWSMSQTGNGSVSTSGVYTAPMKAGTFKVRATSKADSSKWAEASVTVPDVSVSITPVAPDVVQGGTQQFSVTVVGLANKGVTWSVTPSTGSGSVTSSGLYTAPMLPGSYRVRATSKANSAKYAEVMITVPALTISVSPVNLTLAPGGTQAFTAVVAGAANKAVDWSVPTGHGSITSAGLYTAPTTQGTYTVVASSKADATKKASAAVVVKPVVAVSLSPSKISLCSHSTQVFLAKVTGSSNTAVRWAVSAGGGWVSESGIYHAPPIPGTYTITATSEADPGKSATSTVTVEKAAGVQAKLSPEEITIPTGATFDFQAEWPGASNGVSFQYSASAGKLAYVNEGRFTYTAASSAGDCYITVKLKGGSTQACALIHVVPPTSGISVWPNPSSACIRSSESLQLTASVLGATSTGVTWAVMGGAENGSIDENGWYTAPANPGLYTVTATSQADPSRSNQTRITVLPRISIEGPAWLDQGDKGAYAATVVGMADQRVVWACSQGAITQDGVFTPSGSGNVWITVTSLGEPRAVETCLVQVPDVSVGLSPSGDVSLPGGESSTLWATISGTIDHSVQWSVVSGDGRIEVDPKDPLRAIFLSPFSPGTTVVQVISVSEPTKKANVTFQITENPIPVIRSFGANPMRIDPGGTSYLKAEFGNGTGNMMPGNVTVTTGTQVPVTPAGTTVYTLAVTGPQGDSRTMATPVLVNGPGRFTGLPSPLLDWNEWEVQRSRVLVDRQGRVLLIGGKLEGATGVPVQRLDIAMSKWTLLGFIGNIPGLDYFTALMLPDERILLLGGAYTEGGRKVYSGKTPIFDTRTGVTTRVWETSPGASDVGGTVLPDGRILMVGGYGMPPDIQWCVGCEGPRKDIKLFDPERGVWETVKGENQIGWRNKGIMLLDGRVLLTGDNLMEVFDPAINTVSVVQTPVGFISTIAVRSDGKVIVSKSDSSGSTYYSNEKNTFGLWDPATNNLQWDLVSNFGGLRNGAVLGGDRVLVGDWYSAGTLLDPMTLIMSSAEDCEVISSNYNYKLIADSTPSGKPVVFVSKTNAGEGFDVKFFEAGFPWSIQPAYAEQNAGLAISYGVAGIALPASVTWTASGGVIDQNGYFSADKPGLYCITATTLAGKSTTAWARVVSPIYVRMVEPTTQFKDGIYYPQRYPGNGDAYHAGVSWQLKAEADRHPDNRVTWSLLEGESAGTITADGIYTAKAAGVYHVVATSVADPTKSAILQVTVKEAVNLSISPSSMTVNPLDSISFVANEPSGDSYADWYLNGVRVSGGRTFKDEAPIKPGTYTLEAVSIADRSKRAIASITVLNIDSFVIAPANVSIAVTGEVSYKARITVGSVVKEVTNRVIWSTDGGSFSTSSVWGRFVAGTVTGTYQINAELEGTSLTANTAVTITPIDALHIFPGRHTMTWERNERYTFKAYIESSGRFQQTALIDWSCSGGSINQTTGVYTPPSAATTETITATFRGTPITATASVSIVPGSRFETNGGTSAVNRDNPMLTRLLDGTVLITGGKTDRAEIYDPKTRSFSAISAVMTQKRFGHSATLLPSGKVLIVGGGTVTAELYDPNTRTFLATGQPLFKREDSVSLLLPNGKVLLAGGSDGYSGKSIEIYDPLTATFSFAGFLKNSITLNTLFDTGASILLADGRVLFVSGRKWDDVAANECEWFDSSVVKIDQKGSLVSLHSNIPALFQLNNESIWIASQKTTEWMDLGTLSTKMGMTFESNHRYGSELVDGSIYLYGSGKKMRAFPEKGIAIDARELSYASGAQEARSILLPDGDMLCTYFSVSGSTPTRDAKLQVFDVLNGVLVQPRRITLLAGQAWPFMASGAGGGSSEGFTWRVKEGGDSGSVNAQGVYTAPYTPGVYHVVASSLQGALQASAEVRVVPGVQVSLSPSLIQLKPGQTLGFTASIVGSVNSAIRWSASDGAVISETGLFTAPTKLGTYRVTAFSAEDASAFASAIVVVSTSAAAIPLPILTSFRSDTLVVLKGEPVKLTWEAEYAYDVTLKKTNQAGYSKSINVSGLKDYIDKPSDRSRYYLVLTNPSGVVSSREIVVDIISKPIIINISPSTIDLICGQKFTFGFSLDAPTTRKIWSCTGGVIGQDGLYEAPKETGNYGVTVTSVDDPRVSASATVIVRDSTKPVTISIFPSAIDLYCGEKCTFGFSLDASTDRKVWSCTGGVIGQDGAYEAPKEAGVYGVTVTSVDDPRVSASANVVVRDIILNLTPRQATLSPGETLQFGYEFQGAEVSQPVWSCTGGSLNGNVYTAPLQIGDYRVVLTSQNLGRSVTASIRVVPVSLAVTPSQTQILLGGKAQFMAVISSGSAAWSVVPDGGGQEVGTIDVNGMYTAPARAGIFTIVAQSDLDSTITASAKVVVMESIDPGATTGIGTTGAVIKLAPGYVEIDAGSYHSFSASVEGAADAGIAWTVNDRSPDVSIDENGVFTSCRKGVYTITAASKADPTAITRATIKVVSALKVDVSPLEGIRGYTVTALDDGKVLIAGGMPIKQPDPPPGKKPNNNWLFSEKAWLYDPESRTYVPTGNMLTARGFHQAVKLKDGRVLIAGGSARWMTPHLSAFDNSLNKQIPWATYYPFAEIYNPKTGAFEALPSNPATHEPTSVDNPYDQCAVKNSSDIEHLPWNIKGPGVMWSSHSFGSSVCIADGRVLIAGGDDQSYWSWIVNRRCLRYNGYGPRNYQYPALDGADIFDPATGLFDIGKVDWRYKLGATKGGTQVPCDSPNDIYYGAGVRPRLESLDDGRVLMTYGHLLGDLGNSNWVPELRPSPPVITQMAPVVIDMKTMATADTGPMQRPRFNHSMTKLADGRVLVVGGYDFTQAQYTGNPDLGWNFQTTATAEIYDPVTNKWRMTKGSLRQARGLHASLLLPDGKVVVIGGYHTELDGSWGCPNTIEVFDPETETFSVMDYLDYGLSEPQLVMLPDGNVFMAGQVQAPMEVPSRGNRSKSGVGNRLRSLSSTTSVWTQNTSLLGQVVTPKPRIMAEMIKFNHDTSFYNYDAINIRISKKKAYNDPTFSLGEWVLGKHSIPICYVANRDISVKVRLSVYPRSIKSAKVWAVALATDGTLKNLKPTIVRFENGISLSDDPMSTLGYCTFYMEELVPNRLNKTTTDRWQWMISDIDGKESVPEKGNITGPFTVYTILSNPLEPWIEAPNQDQNVWVSALDFCMDAANCKGIDKKEDAMKALTRYLFSGHGVKYDVDTGIANYTKAELFWGMARTYNLTGYLNKSGGNNRKENTGNVVICLDQAGALFVLSHLLGINTDFVYTGGEQDGNFGYINLIDLVGIGRCNNPAFGYNKLPPITGLDDPSRAIFQSHCWVELNEERVYDATLGPMLGDDNRLGYKLKCLDLSTAQEKAAATATGYKKTQVTILE